jgi:hypothetical protein
MTLSKTQRAIADAMATVQTMTDDPPGWEFCNAIANIAYSFERNSKSFSAEAFMARCHRNSTPGIWSGDDEYA